MAPTNGPPFFFFSREGSATRLLLKLLRSGPGPVLARCGGSGSPNSVCLPPSTLVKRGGRSAAIITLLVLNSNMNNVKERTGDGGSATGPSNLYQAYQQHGCSSPEELSETTNSLRIHLGEYLYFSVYRVFFTVPRVSPDLVPVAGLHLPCPRVYSIFMHGTCPHASNF